MDYRDIFNPETCNIFCDGSIHKVESTGETIGCPGAVCVLTDEYGNRNVVDYKSYILRDCTNNMTENRALLLAVYRAIDYYRIGYKINIFGDSQYCIYGITKWIFSWINCMYNGHMYNSSGQEVKNEQFIIELFCAIYYNNLYANFYHQKGHVNHSPASQKKASECFTKSNGIRIVDPLLIQVISEYNDMVDVQTKQDLDNFILQDSYHQRFCREDYQIPANFYIDNTTVNMDNYKTQIKRRRRYV
jgi:ribonuclease HI